MGGDDTLSEPRGNATEFMQSKQFDREMVGSLKEIELVSSEWWCFWMLPGLDAGGGPSARPNVYDASPSWWSRRPW